MFVKSAFLSASVIGSGTFTMLLAVGDSVYNAAIGGVVTIVLAYLSKVAAVRMAERAEAKIRAEMAEAVRIAVIAQLQFESEKSQVRADITGAPADIAVAALTGQKLTDQQRSDPEIKPGEKATEKT